MDLQKKGGKGKGRSCAIASDPADSDSLPVCSWCKVPQKRNSKVQQLLGRYHDLYLETLGRCPVGFAPSGGATFSALLKEADEQDIRTAVSNFFESTDPWIVEHSYPITKLRSDFNALREHPIRGPKHKEALW